MVPRVNRITWMRTSPRRNLSESSKTTKGCGHMTTTNQFLSAADGFWRQVSAAEQHVNQNSHRGLCPPCCYGDPWNEEFAEAYAKLRPWLKLFRSNRIYPVPPGIMYRPSPIQAESASQALMFFLNPPKQLEGCPGVLETNEYLAMKSDAIQELDDADKRRRKKRSPKKPYSRSSRRRAQLLELRALLINHHFPENDEFSGRCLTGKEIGKALNCSQSTASRLMSLLFQRKDGMEAYNKVFSTDRTPRGYLRQFDDDTLSVEAITRSEFREDDPF